MSLSAYNYIKFLNSNVIFNDVVQSSSKKKKERKYEDIPTLKPKIFHLPFIPYNKTMSCNTLKVTT